MKTLDDCIDKIFEKSVLVDSEEERELLKSAYHHLCDYKDILNKSVELTKEINTITSRWEMVKKANEE